MIREVQAQLADILALYSTNPGCSKTPRVGIDTKKAFKKFCNSLYEIGVTAEVIKQKKEEVLNVFMLGNTATSTGNFPRCSNLTYIIY